MKAKVNVGDVAIDLEGTLTEVLCTLDAIDGDEPEESKKTRTDWIEKLSHAFLNNEYIDFFGYQTKIANIRTDYNIRDCGYIDHTFIFTDGSEIVLRDFVW